MTEEAGLGLDAAILDPGVWRRLVDDDRAFLEWQLGAPNIEVVLMNGAAIVAELRTAGMTPDLESGVIEYEASDGARELRVVRGRAGGKHFLGWNRPLAGAISTSGRDGLIAWVRDSIDRWGVGPPRCQPARIASTRPNPAPSPSPPVELVDGFIPSVHRVDSVSELEAVLRHWYEGSDQPTVGDIAGYGGSPVIAAHTEGGDFVLNRDTKRSAVDAFLTAAERAGGADMLDWQVAAGARGGFRRVSYLGDAPTPGWYTYLKKAERGPRRLDVSVRPSATPPIATEKGADEAPRGDQPVGAMQVVQFVHPGFEYHRAEHVGRRNDPSGVMAWKPGLKRDVPADDRDTIWDEVVRQVTEQGCGLGYHAPAPPVLSQVEATRAATGPSRPLHRGVT